MNNTLINPSIPELMELHFDPKWGAPFWLDRRGSLGFDPRREVMSEEDLFRFGPFPEEEIRHGPSLRFVSRRFHEEVCNLVLSETGGATGHPKRVYFSQDEFRAGFIDPFVLVAKQLGWPMGARWLFVGPTGPHIIGQVLDPICRELGSPPPFRVDFDPRWARKLVEGSVARERYLEHIVAQAMNILEREEVGVLFATPPTLKRLAERMTDEARAQVRGVHYGGTAVSPEERRAFEEEAFPRAVHLSGYGNSLVGVAFEADPRGDGPLRYYPSAPRHRLRVVALEGGSREERLRAAVTPGESGQVVVSRLDRSCFIPNLFERDRAASLAPSKAAKALGWDFPGIHNPHPLSLGDSAPSGLY